MFYNQHYWLLLVQLMSYGNHSSFDTHNILNISFHYSAFSEAFFSPFFIVVQLSFLKDHLSSSLLNFLFDKYSNTDFYFLSQASPSYKEKF